jgi:hypothetical protein
MKLIGRVRRWIHCLLRGRGHQQVTLVTGLSGHGKVEGLGCSCDSVFWLSRKAQRERYDA